MQALSMAIQPGSIGRVLRERREERGMSLGALAARSGIDKSTLSRWERGTVVPRAAALAGVLKVLGVPNGHVPLVQPPSPLLPGPEHLRAMRYAFDLSQEAFAERLGVTQATVSRWESGKTSVPTKAVRKAGICLGMEAQDIEQMFLTDADPLPPTMGDESVERLDDLVSSIFLHSPVQMSRSQGLVASLRLQTRLPMLAAGDSRYVPVLARFLSRQAVQRSEQGDWAGAESCTARTLRLGFDAAYRAGQALPFIVQSRVRRREGELGRALEVLEQALRGPVPHEVRTWMMGELAELIALTGEFREGVRLAAAAVSDEPSSESVWFRRKTLARILVRGEQYARALEVFPPRTTENSYPAQMDEAEIWAQAFLGLGESKSAEPWILRFEELVQTPGLRANRPRADRLRKAHERAVKAGSPVGRT